VDELFVQAALSALVLVASSDLHVQDADVVERERDVSFPLGVIAMKIKTNHVLLAGHLITASLPYPQLVISIHYHVRIIVQHGIHHTLAVRVLCKFRYEDAGSFLTFNNAVLLPDSHVSVNDFL
jgi:hypothetical protein